jgi:hypothetical protein
MAGVIANGGVDAHLNGLLRLGLIYPDQTATRIWRPAPPDGKLAKATRALLKALAETSDTPPARSRPKSTTSTTARALRTVSNAESAVTAAQNELGEEAVEEILGLLEQARFRLQGATSD